MEYPLLILGIIVTLIHCQIIRISLRILFTTDINVLNRVLTGILCSVMCQILIGDCAIIYYATFIGEYNDLYILIGFSDYCAIIIFQTLSATFVHYRSVLLYKGYAKRFYEYALKVLILKALVTPLLSMIGLIISQQYNFNILAYNTITQLAVAISNFFYFLMLRKKFEEMNNRYMVRPITTANNLNQIVNQSHTVAQEHYEVTKKEIHRNMGITLVAMSLFIVSASILLGIFHQFDHRSGYYISLSYRFLFTPAILAAIIPIHKTCVSKRKSMRNTQQRLVHHEKEREENNRDNNNNSHNHDYSNRNDNNNIGIISDGSANNNLSDEIIDVKL